jgi:hypothetical protein
VALVAVLGGNVVSVWIYDLFMIRRGLCKEDGGGESRNALEMVAR